MTNLRQVAQQALEALKSAAIFVDSFRGQKATQEAITALQTELAQPEQEPTQWRDMVVVSLVREGINKHKARELADHFATPPAAQRPWVGLTDEDRRKFAAAQYGWEDLLIAAEAKLKERNGY